MFYRFSQFSVSPVFHSILQISSNFGKIHEDPKSFAASSRPPSLRLSRTGPKRTSQTT